MYETKKLISKKRGKYLIKEDSLTSFINQLSKEFHIENYELHKKVHKVYKHNSFLYDIIPELLYNKTLLLALYICKDKKHIRPDYLARLINIHIYYIPMNGFIDYPSSIKPMNDSIEKAISFGYFNSSITSVLDPLLFLKNTYSMVYSQNIPINDILRHWANLVYDCLYLFSKNEQSFKMVTNLLNRDLQEEYNKGTCCNQK